MTDPTDRRTSFARRIGAARLTFGRFRMYRPDLGLARSARLALADRRGRTGELSVPWPGYDAPFRLRAGGSDVLTFHQVIVRDGYRFPFELARTPQVIIDAGANIGMSAVWYAAQFPDARIVAIEPEDANFDQLLRNIAPYPNVSAVKAALWPESAALAVRNAPGGSFGFRVEPGDDATNGSVRAITVPDLLAEHDIEYVDVFKIDIEGAEKELFEGDTGWLDRVGAVAIELHDRFKPGCADAFGAATQAFTMRHTEHDETFVMRPSA